MGTLNQTIRLTLATLFLLSLVTVSATSPPVHAALTWNLQTVDEDAWVGGNCPMALDSNNTTHIAYMGFGNGTSGPNRLIYASNNSSGWTYQIADSVNVFTVFSLVLDANSNPHILYSTTPCRK